MGFINNLRICSIDNPDYDNLYTKFGAVIINTKDKLKIVPNYFRHFSRHDETHSEKIIHYLEMLLGDVGIKRLSLSDQLALVLAAYMHDIGMALEHNRIDDYFKQENFANELREKIPGGYKDLDAVVDEVLAFPESVRNCKNADVIRIYTDVCVVIENLFRNGHAGRSAEYIVANAEITDLLGIRGTKLLAKICKLHDGSIEKIMTLPKEENGWFDDYLHPRFVAGLLCLGDLLDLDTDRFDMTLLKAASPMPYLSLLHKKKHECIEHYLVKSGVIEIQADCDGYDVYQTVYQWTKWIADACTFLVVNWDEITPDITILSPRLKVCKISINGNSKWIGRVEPKLHIDTAKAIKIFEGSNIYRGKWIFVRELIQNAVDASLVQLCLDADYEKKRNNDHNPLTSKDILSFFMDKKLVVDNYNISGRIFTLDNNENMSSVKGDCGTLIEKTVIFELEDHGTGIAESEIDSIVGLKGKSDSLKRMISSFPMFFRPAGVFGIGLQSVFQVASKIEFITKTENERAKVITIIDPSTTGHVYIEDFTSIMQRGTKVRVTFDLEKFTQTDFTCGNYIFKTTPKYQLLINWLFRHMYNLEKKQAPIFEAQRQTEDCFNIDIKLLSTEGGNEISVLQRKSILTGLADENLENIVIKDGRLFYSYRDFENNCLYDAKLLAGHEEESDKEIQFGRRSDWYDQYTRNYGNNVFYRNVLTENNLFYDKWLDINKIGKFIDFKINIFAVQADEILNVGRNQIRSEYQETLRRLLEYEFSIMFKQIIDYCIKNNIKNRRIIFLAYIKSLFYGYKTDEFYRKFSRFINKTQINNYYALDGKEKTIRLKDINNVKIYFLREIDEKRILEYPSVLWEDKKSCKEIKESKNEFIFSFNIPDKRINTEHVLIHYLKGEYFTTIGKKHYLVYEVVPFTSEIKLDAPFRAAFIRYKEFISVLLADVRCVNATVGYKDLETPVIERVISPYYADEEMAVEVAFDPVIQIELATLLEKDGYIKDAHKYLNKIKETEKYKQNVDYIFEYRQKKDERVTKKDIEDKYQRFIAELLVLLENEIYAEYLRCYGHRYKVDYSWRNNWETDFIYYDDYLIKRFVGET